MPTIRILEEFGRFQPGEVHDTDETNPFLLLEKCERYVASGRAEWVGEHVPDELERLAEAGIVAPDVTELETQHPEVEEDTADDDNEGSE